MDDLKVGDAAVSSTGIIFVIVKIENDWVYYVRSSDNFSRVLQQTSRGWLMDFTDGYKPIILTEAQKILYGL